MKLKITPKDAVLFVVFSIFLLFFSAIAVLNVINLINEGEFHGFNPMEAFRNGKMFGVTLFVWISVLASIIASVSSTIFDFEKGKGFGINFSAIKEENGYSRWLTEKEMKKSPNIYKVGVKDAEAAYGGVVFINDGKNMWVDNSDYHTIVIGTTGGGKTTAVVDPLIYSLCQHGESMIITDPKGEIYKHHSELLKARGYKLVVLNFRYPELGNAWNPLTLPFKLFKDGNVDKATELLDDVARNIFIDKDSKDDPFWSNSAADYFSGCALGLFEDAKEEEINIKSISYMTSVGEDRFGAGSNYIKEYFNFKGEATTAYTFANNTVNAPGDTKGSILSVYRQKIRLFAARERLSEMLSYSDFEMADIGREKTAVFMIIHDEKTTYHALATIFLKQCYETLIDVAQENGGSLKYRTNFILDEFANMPPLKDVTTMVTAARSRKIRFTFIIQNFAQLNDVYGKDDAETIRSNCNNLIYLLTTELSALEEISKLCGEVKAKDDEKVNSQPLITVSDLQKLKMNEVIILRSRLHPFRVQLKPAYEIDWGDSEFSKDAPYPEREVKEVALFDIKEFVTVRKKSKMNNDLKGGKGMFGDFSPMGGNPFGGGFSPMGGMDGLGTSPSMPKIPTFEEFLQNKSRESAGGKPNIPMELDVDSIVKKIDQKLAELEKQEKEENELKAKNSVNVDAIGNPDGVPNPFGEIKKESDAKFVEKDDIFELVNDDIEDKTEVLQIVPEDKIKNFDDLIKQNSVEEKEENLDKTQRIDINEISKPLGGIEMVGLNEISKDEKPKEEKKVVPIQTTKKQVINTIPTEGVKVDTDSKIINDDFFDDFF